MALEHIDTVIAFAAVMTGVSLFVTVLVQMIVALLGLRGLHLCRGLETLLGQLAPELRDHAAALAEEVLQHPLISDSTMVRADSFLMRLLPESVIDQFEVVRRLLKNWRLASAIRIEELVNILHRLTEELPRTEEERTRLKDAISGLKTNLTGAKGKELEERLNDLVGCLPLNSPWRSKLRASPSLLEALQQDIDRKLALADALQRLETQAATRTHEVIDELKSAIGDLSSKDVVTTVRQLFPHLAAKADRAAGDLREWFDSTMDRATEHFTVHTRIWTAVFALLIALALQLDSLALLKRLSSDAELRARLVASADTLTQKADDILQTAGSTNPPARILVTAMEQLTNRYPADLGGLRNVAGFTNLTQVETWFRLELKRANPAAATNENQIQGWLKDYRDLLPQAELRVAAGRIQSMLEDDLALELIPVPYPADLNALFKAIWDHFPGIIVSAALLSLGAPFWFNLLKTLSNLRPILAQKQEKESRSAGGA